MLQVPNAKAASVAAAATSENLNIKLASAGISVAEVHNLKALPEKLR